MLVRAVVVFFGILLVFGLACSKPAGNNATQGGNTTSYKNAVKQALEQADLTDVTVSEDDDKNTITLGGKVHSENAKDEAATVAQAAAGPRVVANQVLVEAAGSETESKKIQSNLDSAIEKNFKAAIQSKGLDKQHIRFDAKNGVLTLKGSVKSPRQKEEAQQVASSIPNVQQVLNQIGVQR